MTKKYDVEESSGNVFVDLEVSDPEEAFIKAQLAFEICRILEQKKLKQREAAKVLNVDPPSISQLKNGKLMGFPIQKLMYYLNILGKDVEIVIKQKPKSRKLARVTIKRELVES